jgi:HAD superfamily hydrolase (TIGR01509 family)
MTSKLPFDAVVFDLDGVITQTALVHSSAWKEMFDNYLKSRQERYNEPFKEFTHEDDYLKYVDGKPRYEGVKSFLESRKINIPFGNPNDSSDMETCCGIGNLKNKFFNQILDRDGIQVYQSTVDFIHQLKDLGIKVGVASSSKNCETVLKSAGLIHLIETRVDGVVSADLGLKGKPEPDIFTTAADNLNSAYHRTIIVEDAISGVQAGKKGNFGLVLGLAREDNNRDLLLNGADIVIDDISEIDVDDLVDWFDNGLVEDGWSLISRDYNPENERSREALNSVGNGYFGTRGAMEETDINKINYPGTYMAGVFNRRISKVSGKDIENEDFVNVINWLPITFKIDDGDWFDINKTKILEIERKLDFKTGIFYKVLTVEDDQDRITKIFTRRFASMNNPNIAGIHYCIQSVNYSGTISYKSKISGNHINEGVARYAELNQNHLMPLTQSGTDNIQNLVVNTTESNIYISAQAKLDLLYNGKLITSDFHHISSDGEISSIVSAAVEPSDYLGLMKTVCLKNSHEKPNLDSTQLTMYDFETELVKSIEAWEKIWKQIDISIIGDRLSQKLIRLHLYHLISGTSIHNKDIDFGIPARGLTGEAYRGHIFWDELYILPFYFIHFPEIAKSILMYRYRRLDAARKYAQEFGYQGAMFPWQSGSDGREETQKFHFNPLNGKWGDDHSSLQRHVSLAIAYNIIQYYKFTEDQDFMLDYGLEILFEIGKFWASKCEFDAASNRFTIDKVMGPDEFHEAYYDAPEGGLKNNAYTNIMTIWMFEEIVNICDKLEINRLNILKSKVNINSTDFELWETISKKLKLDISEEGIIAQYEGYFNLKELDWDYYHKKYGNVHRMDRVLKAENLSPDEYKVAKQADALMTFYNLDNERVTQIIENLGYSLPKDYIKKNLEYYLKRTSHGSTLSRVVHSYLANQLEIKDLSWSMYNEALKSDYNDIQGGTTAEGIHTGVMAGTIWILISTFAGIEFGDYLSINPNLPMHWDEIKFNLNYKNCKYIIVIQKESIEILSDTESSIRILDSIYSLKSNKVYTFKY